MCYSLFWVNEMIKDTDLEKVMHFSRSYQRFLLEMDNAAAGDDLSGAEARCLLVLAFHKKQTLVDLNKRYGTDLAFLSRMVKRLVERGFISREPNPEDGRSVLLTLTGKGAEQIPVLKARVRGYFQNTFGLLSDSQALELIGHMQAIDMLLQNGVKDIE